jgi:hypothetical protein
MFCSIARGLAQEIMYTFHRMTWRLFFKSWSKVTQDNSFPCTHAIRVIIFPGISPCKHQIFGEISFFFIDIFSRSWLKLHDPKYRYTQKPEHITFLKTICKVDPLFSLYEQEYLLFHLVKWKLPADGTNFMQYRFSDPMN